MLKSGFLATNVYMSVAHNETTFKKYESKLDRTFYKISLCEKGAIKIDDILEHPVTYLPFQRLN